VSKINQGKQKYFQFNIVVSRLGGGGGFNLVGSAVRNKIQSYWGRTVHYWLNIPFNVSVQLLLITIRAIVTHKRVENWELIKYPFSNGTCNFRFLHQFFTLISILFVFYWIVFQETDFKPKWVVLLCLHDYGTSFCTGSKILIWYSTQNKFALVWLVMVWNLVLVSCKQSYTEP